MKYLEPTLLLKITYIFSFAIVELITMKVSNIYLTYQLGYIPVTQTLIYVFIFVHILIILLIIKINLLLYNATSIIKT